MDIEKRRTDRLRVMKAIFDMSGGSEDQQVLGHELAARVELTPQELGNACHYLAGEGLIEEAMLDMGASPVPYWINITHQGIREMEQSLQAPSEPTQHFPQPSRSSTSVAASSVRLSRVEAQERSKRSPWGPKFGCRAGVPPRIRRSGGGP
jgi:hypothetical protein